MSRKTPTMKLSVSTDQEAFDTVVRHLAGMKRRSFSHDTEGCMYRGPGRNRCAIGAIIPRFYGEDRGVLSHLVKDGRIELGAVSPVLLTELQAAHDEGTYWDATTGFAQYDVLSHVADRFDLSHDVLDEVAR